MKARYSFSKDAGGLHVGVVVSDDLHGRLETLCNLLEMSRSSLVRFLITRGVDQLEAKLVERATKLRKSEEEGERTNG